MIHKVQVRGHRGAAGLAPENTRTGFLKAVELGCDAVELDVHLTKDRQLVVIHDDSVDRTTDATGGVSEYTLKELQELECGNGEGIPSLEEVLILLRPSRLVVQIELKGPETAAPAAEMVIRAGMAERVRFTSFFHTRVADAGVDIIGSDFPDLVITRLVERGLRDSTI